MLTSAGRLSITGMEVGVLILLLHGIEYEDDDGLSGLLLFVYGALIL